MSHTPQGGHAHKASAVLGVRTRPANDDDKLTPKPPMMVSIRGVYRSASW